MDDLVAFIEARLTEDERTTIAFRDGHAGPCINYEGQDPEDYSEWDSCSRHIATAKASRYRDTSFGLRDVAAKRRILAWAIRVMAGDYAPWNEDCIMLLALPYSEHPGFRPEWLTEEDGTDG